MRLLGILALATPLAFGIFLLAVPDALASQVDEGGRLMLAAFAAALSGVGLTALLVAGYFRYRFSALVKAAERIAAGDYTTAVVPRSHGLDGRLSRAVNDIAGALADTHDRATIDRLTGVANRQSLLAALFAEVERAHRYERALSVAFVDIDHFKAVNDSYGHAVGDIVLRGVAQTIAGNLRASDLIGRYGGEEFMLILTETGVEEGSALTEKLRTMVQRQRFEIDGGQEISVTISIGIVGGVGQQLRMESLVRDADAAMYSAKALGRNQVYVFSEPDDDARVPRAPISAAGRARAMEIGLQARDAATAALTAVLSPLPHYRGQPSPLIASIVVTIAKQLQLPDAEIDKLRVAALLHDVGKVAVPQEILDKPSALTSVEWRTVVQHPRIGQVILEQAAALKDAVPIILHHHERYAGHGYPYGLRANEIPLGARIVAIADAYDAMVHDRPYKRAMSHDQAIAELRRHAGTQFDPELVELFCDLYADHAPEPDVTVTALNAASAAHHGGSGGLVLPEPATAARAARRRRRSDLRPADAPSEAPEGAADAADAADAAAAANAAAAPVVPAPVALPGVALPAVTDPSGTSQTMAPDGALGLAPSTVRAMPTERSGRSTRGRSVVN
jgi:diguanylate cyclase (GGDEF)-like protein